MKLYTDEKTLTYLYIDVMKIDYIIRVSGSYYKTYFVKYTL